MPAARRPIARGDHGDRCRPGDHEIGIIVGNADVLGGIVRAVNAITHVGGHQSLESVEESRWDVEVSELLIVETEGLMMAECRGARPDVDHHVVNDSVSAADEFGLAAAGTPVHSSDHPGRRARLRVLDESRCSTGTVEVRVEDLGVEGASEQSSIVAMHIGRHHKHICQLGGIDSHEVIVA